MANSLFRPFLVSLLILMPLYLKATIFTVVSNADNGPGTLREAIIKAAANGTDTRDYIYFNLPGPYPAGKTITLLSNLPSITSNLVIDGSTQPGNSFGPNGAKVYVSRLIENIDDDCYGLILEDVNKVEIYGLILKKSKISFNKYNESGIKLGGQCSDIIIGSTGKGNVINGYTYGISQQYEDLTSNILIQDNFIGWEEDGLTTNLVKGTAMSISLGRIRNIKLEGNTVTGYNNGTELNCDGGTIEIINNRMGVDINGSSYLHVNMMLQGMLQIRGINGSIPEKALIADNLIAGNSQRSIVLTTLPKGFTIVRNKIGTDVTGNNILGERQWGIGIYGCGPSIIGGSITNKNIIAGCTFGAIEISASFFVTVSMNEMYCNSTDAHISAISIDGYSWNTPDKRPIPFIKVTSCDGSTISGTTTPNAKVEVFSPHHCSGGITCDGRNYIETFIAGQDGKWTYPTEGMSGAIFTATDESGATSDYSVPQFNYKGYEYLSHTACGKNDGTIGGIEIFSATSFHWENEAGNIVGRDTCLRNVPPGIYRLVINSSGCNRPECAFKSFDFTIEDHSPTIMTRFITIENASCGNQNGSIYNLDFIGENLKYSWHNEAGKEVGKEKYLTNVGKGMYTLTITDSLRACSATAGPFELKNISGPTLDKRDILLTDAICNKPTGSISGLHINGSGILSYEWLNSTGETVSNTSTLLNVPAGKYVMKYSDGSACGAFESDSFEIKAVGYIIIDKSKAKTVSSNCDDNTGLIAGLKIINGEILKWTNEDNITIGHAVDLTNVAAGKYILSVVNSLGCTANEQFIIPQVEPEALKITSIITQNPLCGKANGAIKDIIIAGGAPIGWKWKSANEIIVSREKELTNLSEGLYRLFITDSAHCEQLLTTIELKTSQLPTISTSQQIVKDYQCNLHLGSINGIHAEGILPLSYQWISNNNVIGESPDLTGLSAGEYLLKVTDGNNCEVLSPAINISNSDYASMIPIANDITIVKGMTADIKVLNPQKGIYTLYNSSGIKIISSTIGTFKIPGIKTTSTFLIGFEHGTCKSNNSLVKVEVVGGVKIFVPSAFSPNGDGLNDYFRIKAFGIKSFELFVIYDRWGNKIFQSTDVSTGWDGSWRGKKVSAGTYIWILNAIDIIGNAVQQQGVVTVVF